jgi:hypothetical protein
MVGPMLPDDNNNQMDQIIRNFEDTNSPTSTTDLTQFVPSIFSSV